MKKFKISVLAIAALALGACTSDDVVLTDSASSVALDGDGYVSFAINLPTQNSTRAANDNYDDGLPSEYAVNNAYLILFNGATEAAATSYATYPLTTDWQMYGTSTDNITSRSKVTTQIDTPAEGNIYALVVLNASETFMTNNFGTGLTLSQLQNSATDLGGVSTFTSNGFYMCNAPLISTPGTTADPSEGTVTTLAVIDPDKIYHTEEEAVENPAAEIYVERGVAKVTVDAAASYTSQVELGDSGYLTVTVDGYALDQTNDVSNLVRNTTGSEEWWAYINLLDSRYSDYRMAGNVAVATGLYRTYWATDPNYDELPYTPVTDDDGNVVSKIYNLGMTSIIGDDDITYGVVGDEHPQYCLENTFNVAHQNDDETTRAIIKATFGTADAEGNVADFYIWDKNHGVLYTYEQIQELILTALEGNTEIEEALHIYASSSNFFDHFTASLEETTATDDATIVITITTPFTDDDFMDPDTHYTPYPVPTVCTQDGLDVVVAALNDVHTIGYYEGGVSYYSVLIKHFGDDLTYWSDEYMDANATTENARSYPNGAGGATAENNWLGRYSVLRNNWYDLNITSIAEPGSATPPQATGKPDDPTDLWISVEINILSWAKRTQDVEL